MSCCMRYVLCLSPCVQVRTYSGRVQRAMCFVSSPMARLPLEVVPTEKYMALLREGAADNYLEPMYQVGGEEVCGVWEGQGMVVFMHECWGGGICVGGCAYMPTCMVLRYGCGMQVPTG